MIYTYLYTFERNSDNHQIVLCHLTHNQATPYVTWRVDDKGNKLWGHYYDNKEAAYTDFQLRCETLMELEL